MKKHIETFLEQILLSPLENLNIAKIDDFPRKSRNFYPSPSVNIYSHEKIFST